MLQHFIEGGRRFFPDTVQYTVKLTKLNTDVVWCRWRRWWQ